MSEEIKSMIDNTFDGKFNDANKGFADIMTVKLNDLLDQEKVRLADQIFNGGEDDSEDFDPDEEQLELDLEAEGELESDEEDDEEENEEYDDDEDDDNEI